MGLGIQDMGLRMGLGWAYPCVWAQRCVNGLNVDAALIAAGARRNCVANLRETQSRRAFCLPVCVCVRRHVYVCVAVYPLVLFPFNPLSLHLSLSISIAVLAKLPEAIGAL